MREIERERGSGGETTYWFSIKEVNLNYCTKETLSFTVDPYSVSPSGPKAPQFEELRIRWQDPLVEEVANTMLHVSHNLNSLKGVI